MFFTIRLATGNDSLDAASVVQAVFFEYGFTWDPSDYCADLCDLDTHYLSHGNPFWIAVVRSRIVATAALKMLDPLPGEIGTTEVSNGKVRACGADCSLERLYVRADFRGLGIGRGLFETTIEEANRLGRRAMEIWSDKKLENAHRLYGYYGANSLGDRICDDPDESPEWGFVLRLRNEAPPLDV